MRSSDERQWLETLLTIVAILLIIDVIVSIELVTLLLKFSYP